MPSFFDSLSGGPGQFAMDALEELGKLPLYGALPAGSIKAAMPVVRRLMQLKSARLAPQAQRYIPNKTFNPQVVDQGALAEKLRQIPAPTTDLNAPVFERNAEMFRKANAPMEMRTEIPKVRPWDMPEADQPGIYDIFSTGGRKVHPRSYAPGAANVYDLTQYADEDPVSFLRKLSQSGD